MKISGLLPIGSVVVLKGGNARIMITGYAQMREDNTGFYDYCGCIFPRGVLSADTNLLFNQEQIDEVHYLGLIDLESGEFLSKAETSIAKIKEELAAGHAQ